MKEVDSKNVKLNIAADGYEAHISIQPDPSTREMTVTQLNATLRNHGVVFGIKKEVLMIITGKLKQGSIIDKILVAEGVKPFEGVEPKVDYKFEISSKPKETESGKVDYREISTIISVKKEQVLAVKRKLKNPRTGITVTGQKTVFPPIQDIPVPTAENIIKEEVEELTFYKAGCDGALRFENQVMSVFPALDIRQDVDFSVGNIHFRGDVKIGRDVLPDFIVEVQGSIHIGGSAIACQLSASEGIEVRAGIVGKNKGNVRSGAHIIATFVENAQLEATGDITIKNGIIGSGVSCNGFLKVEMSRSRIVGSRIRAARGISAYNVGSRFDTGTILVIGIHPEKEQDYLKIKNTLDTKWNEAKELEKKYGRSTLENKIFSRNISDAAKRDIEKWDILKNQIKSILQHLKKSEEEMYDYDVVIKIKETIYPRVNLQIGKHKLTTSKEYYNVTARYSKEYDKLVIGK
jgi:uncharacterized protein (DUF342 family)